MKRPGWIVAVFAVVLPCVCVAGPKKDQPLVAAVELPTLVTVDMRPAATAEAHADAGEAAEEMLPDAPDVPAPVFSPEVEPSVPEAKISLTQPEFSRAVSPLYSVPVVNAAMRLGGHKFNTADGSSVNAFAICYRLNRRSSVQVIPGDPAPVKLPVATLANNTGVTVGMVYRLTRRP